MLRSRFRDQAVALGFVNRAEVVLLAPDVPAVLQSVCDRIQPML